MFWSHWIHKQQSTVLVSSHDTLNWCCEELYQLPIRWMHYFQTFSPIYSKRKSIEINPSSPQHSLVHTGVILTRALSTWVEGSSGRDTDKAPLQLAPSSGQTSIRHQEFSGLWSVKPHRLNLADTDVQYMISLTAIYWDICIKNNNNKYIYIIEPIIQHLPSQIDKTRYWS